MPVSTTASPPTGSTATPPATPSPAADTSSGFSTGEIVGVAVGVIAAFGLSLGLAYFLLQRRERSRTAGVAAQPASMYGQNNEIEDYRPVNTDPYGYYRQRELPGDQPRAELQHGYQTSHEVP
jgi:uncharacterized protein HemX